MSTKSEIKLIVLSASSAMTVKRRVPSAGGLGGYIEESAKILIPPNIVNYGIPLIGQHRQDRQRT